MEAGVAWAYERHWRSYRGAVAANLSADSSSVTGQFYSEVAATLAHAMPMYVSPRIDEAVLAASFTFPERAVVDTQHVIQPYSIWLDRPQGRSLLQEHKDQHFTTGYIVRRAVLPSLEKEGLLVTPIYEVLLPNGTFARSMQHTYAWPDGARAYEFLWHDLQGNLDLTQEEHKFFILTALYFLALNAWIETKVARVIATPIERHARKRLINEGTAPHDSPFHVVVLRAFETTHERHDQEYRQIAWKSRWFVRPHWRHLTSDRLTWVHSYIKGPPDKPLSTPKHTVFAAVR